MLLNRRSRPNPYQSRQHQFRLLRLVGLAAVVMVLVQLAAKPSSWNWFAALDSQRESERTTAEFGGDLKPIDIKRPTPREPLPEDTYYARVGDDAPTGTDVPDPLAAAPQPSLETAEGAEQHASATSPAGPLDLPADQFSEVADDWFGLTRGEQPALQAIATKVKTVDPDALQQAASREATFDVLVNHPDYYRGRPVHLAGRVRRLVPARIGVGDEARDVWEAWIFTPDSRKTPLLVYALDRPAAMPTGEQIDEAVAVDAYFVRRYAYASVGGESLTVMLMSPRLQWSPPQPAPVRQLHAELQTSTILGAVLLGSILLAVGLWYFLSDRKFRRSRLHAIGEARLDATPESLSQLAELDRGDPHRITIDDSAATPSAS